MQGWLIYEGQFEPSDPMFRGGGESKDSVRLAYSDLKPDSIYYLY